MTAETEAYGVFERLLESSIQNLTQAFFDDFEHENAKLRQRAGLQMFVVRRELFRCCSWCAKLAGTYLYGEEPREVWQRHRNCKCIVITKTKKGTWQDAWNRREFEQAAEARKAREQEILKEESMTPEERIEAAERLVKERRERYNQRRRESYRLRRLSATGTTKGS